MEGLEQICFRIISAVGMAKSSYVEAMRAAAGGDYELSGQKMKEGDEFYAQGHDVHMDLPVSYTHLTLPTNREV